MTDQPDRLTNELDLFQSIYPDRATYTPKGRELHYTTETGALKLRLPDGYLKNALPEALSASSGKSDIRNEVKESISQMGVGEEILDLIILSFNDICESKADEEHAMGNDNNVSSMRNIDSDSKATIIIWLHHLLNTNKRKQCLAPPSGVSGITKPGYPGVLIYSGPAKSVHEHVNELKGLNWAAIQVRLESEEEWTFRHGKGVVEVEAMKDVVADVGEERKEGFLESMRMK